tara:strand:+ start:852 stop:1007 length:156 start_codon:yes stop_codon:yes gene_type:complete
MTGDLFKMHSITISIIICSVPWEHPQRDHIIEVEKTIEKPFKLVLIIIRLA